MTRSTTFPRQGDKQNSAFFEEYLIRLLEERDQIGLTDMIDQIDAIMITVDPGNSIRYIGELALTTPYHYLVTLESKRRTLGAAAAGGWWLAFEHDPFVAWGRAVERPGGVAGCLLEDVRQHHLVPEAVPGETIDYIRR